MHEKLAALNLGREYEPLSDLHGCQQWWWLCMEVFHLLWELYRKFQVPSSLSIWRKFVSFTALSSLPPVLMQSLHCLSALLVQCGGKVTTPLHSCWGIYGNFQLTFWCFLHLCL